MRRHAGNIVWCAVVILAIGACWWAWAHQLHIESRGLTEAVLGK